MQSNKTPKKSLKKADEPAAAAPEKLTAEATSKPRGLRSSRTKKTEVNEAGSGKHHHKMHPAPVDAAVAKPATLATQKPSAFPTESAVDPIVSAVPSRIVSRQHIAELAYSYWEARGYRHGSSEEDWLRAEQELHGIR